MIQYDDTPRTLGDRFLTAGLGVYARLPRNRVFDRNGEPLERCFRQAAAYRLPADCRRRYGVLETGDKDVYRMDSGRPGRTIFYLHGGAYWSQPSRFHFAFLRRVLEQAGGQAVIPVYPKAPAATYREVYRFVQAAYENTVRTCGAEAVVLMGDSAGGGLALAFGMVLARQGTQHKVIALSPWMDVGCGGEGESRIHDPWLDRATLRRQGEYYAAGTTAADPLVSPLFGDGSLLRDATILTGTDDILSPAAVEFGKRYPNISVGVYPKRNHDFALFSLGVGGKEALRRIVGLLT